MDFSWLAKAIKETTIEVLRYLFVWNKQGDSAPVDKDDKKLDEAIKKDGW